MTVTVLQMGQAFLTTLVADSLFGPAGVAIGFVLNVIVFFVLAEAMPKTWAVLSAERAALSTARPVEWLVLVPAAAVHQPRTDRADERRCCPARGSRRARSSASRSCSASSVPLPTTT